MDFKKLFELIEEDKKRLEKILNTKNEEIKFFDDVISHNTLSSLQGLLSLDCLKVMTAYLCTLPNNLGCEKTYELVKKNEILINPAYDKIKESILNLFELLQNKSTSFIEKLEIKSLENIINKEIKEGLDFNSLQELFECYDNKIFEIMGLMNVINQLKKDYDSSKIEFDEIKTTELQGFRISAKKETEMLKEMLKEDYKVNAMCDELSIIIKHYDKISREDKTKKRIARQGLTNYTKLIKTLKNLSNKDLLDKYIINNILTLTNNEKIQKEILYQINIGQKNYFEELNNEYMKLSQDSKVSIQAIFKEYNLDFNKLSTELKNKILKLKKEELEETLNSIKSLKINDFDTICFILENSTYDILNSFIYFIKDGIMTLDFVLNNKQLLSINENIPNNYNTLIEKLQLFKNEGINYRLFINDQDVYLTDTNIISYNINVLKQYNLLFGLNKLNSFDLLKGNNLENKIDLFLELGYEKILEENLGLLNVDINKIKKLYILKGINLLPQDINELLKVLENETFLNQIDNIDDYIFNIVNYRIDTNLIDKQELDLNKYFLFDDNTRVIEVNNVLLSKNRIKRNLLKLENTNLSEYDKLIYAFIYDSVLSEEEYNIIISNINNINKRIH